MAKPALYSLFGLTLASDYPFANPLLRATGESDLSFTCTTQAPAAKDWRSRDPVMTSPYRFETGEAVFALYRQGDCEVMHFSEVADFYLWPDRIICHLLDPDCAFVVEIYFLGAVISYWLERRGILMLHASGVLIGDIAVGFLASKEGGKSSIVAALMRLGQPLLTDDLLAVKEERGQFIAFPGYPAMRMWPQQAQHFLGHYEDLELVHPHYTKRRAPVGESGFGSFCGVPKRLGGLYLLERRDSGGASCRIEAKRRSEALIELVRNSFVPNLVAAAGLQPDRFHALGRVVEGVPIKTLVYPSGFEYLPSVCAAILEDCSPARNWDPENLRS